MTEKDDNKPWWHWDNWPTSLVIFGIILVGLLLGLLAAAIAIGGPGGPLGPPRI